MENNTKKMEKGFIERNFYKIIGILIILILITSLFIFGTFTKFTSSRTGSDSAKVSNFNYTIMQTEGNDEFLSLNGESINIFDTVDSGISTTNGKKIVAPGVSGCFEFTFINRSKSAVKVMFDTLGYETTKNDSNSISDKNVVPLIFYFNGKYYSDLYNQSFDAHDGDNNDTTGKNYTYYFHAGDAENDAKGIILSGDMEALKNALNGYYKMVTTKDSSKGDDGDNQYEQEATSFLNYATNEEGEKGSVQLGWFWPFEARMMDSNNSVTEQGIDSGSGYKNYIFDDYCSLFAEGDMTVTMSPILRTSQISEFATPVKQTQCNDEYGFDKWYGLTPNWGIDGSMSSN